MSEPTDPAARSDDDLRAGMRAVIRDQELLRETITQQWETIDRLATIVQGLADAQAQHGQPAYPWLDATGSHNDIAQVLHTLIDWMGRVLYWFRDARDDIPECWLWHPDVVAELVVLMDSWRAAYREGAPIHAVADWHRNRPEVIKRIHGYAWPCSLQQHEPDGERWTAAPVVPGAAAVDLLATWWATSGRDTHPAPPPSQALNYDRRHR